jgi:uncharacterized membrane protein
MERLRSALQRIRESLLFIPSLVVAICVLLAGVIGRLDAGEGALGDGPLLLSVSVPGGRAIASAVAGATITVAAIVFSITALSSQIAATQYSPRAVAGFFEDRFQQLAIGLVVGTFAFALLTLANLGGTGSDEATSPSLSVTLTLVLGVASVVAIVAYLDHSLRRMRVGAVVRRIAEDIVEAIRRQQRTAPASEKLVDRVLPEGEPVHVRAGRTGWIRAIDASKLARSLSPGSMARVEVRVGEAISSGDLVATVWVVASGRDVAGKVRRAVHVGRARSLAGDPSYGIRQLVDIGLRALSPGVNDPTTATDVIQFLKLPLREILILETPSRVYVGSGQQRVFLPEAPSRSDHVHAAFSEIRLAAAHQPAVLRALIEILADLIGELEDADLEGRAGALEEEANLAVATAQQAGFPDADLKRVLSASKRLGLDEGTG